MNILKELISNIDSSLELKNYYLGDHNIFVESSVNSGLASCYGKLDFNPHTNIKELAKLSLDSNKELSSLGLAAINSTSILNKNRLEFSNAHEFLFTRDKDIKIAIVGHFSFVEKMRKTFKNLYVFELNPKDKYDLDVKFMPEIIPDVDYLVVTATTLSNHTFENIIKYKSNKTKLMLLGPSTPLNEILFDFKIDIIAGTIVTDKKLLVSDMKKGIRQRFQRGKKYCILRK